MSPKCKCFDSYASKPGHSCLMTASSHLITVSSRAIVCFVSARVLCHHCDISRNCFRNPSLCLSRVSELCAWCPLCVLFAVYSEVSLCVCAYLFVCSEVPLCVCAYLFVCSEVPLCVTVHIYLCVLCCPKFLRVTQYFFVSTDIVGLIILGIHC